MQLQAGRYRISAFQPLSAVYHDPVTQSVPARLKRPAAMAETGYLTPTFLSYLRDLRDLEWLCAVSNFLVNRVLTLTNSTPS